jgi:hypothetical protein
MNRGLLVVGGVLNVLLALFHFLLGYRIHLLTAVRPEHRALMEMLNAGGALMIVFFAVASLAFAADLLGTRLGKLVLGFVSLLYLSRAAEEIWVATRFSALIFAVCAAIGLLYAALLLLPASSRAGATVAASAGA